MRSQTRKKSYRRFQLRTTIQVSASKISIQRDRVALISPIPGFPGKIAHISELSWWIEIPTYTAIRIIGPEAEQTRRSGGKEAKSEIPRTGQLPLEGQAGNRGWGQAGFHNMIQDSRRRGIPSSRSYPRGCMRLAELPCGSPPCSLRSIILYVLASLRVLSTRRWFDFDIPLFIPAGIRPRSRFQVFVFCKRKRNDDKIAAPFVSRPVG